MTFPPHIERILDKPHVVYGLFDCHDRLLYVGCTYDLGQRVSQHTMERPWWHEVTDVRVLASTATRAEGMAGEKRLIRERRPAYNLNGNLRRIDWTVDDYLGTLSAWLKGRAAAGYAGESLTVRPPGMGQSQKLIRALAQRYGVQIQAETAGEALAAVEAMREARRLAAVAA